MRFDGIGTYVTALLEESGLQERLSASNVKKIQLSAFLKLLDEFLRDGTEAAIHAVDAFASLDISGFRIGAQEFEGRNQSVMRGAKLSEALRRALADNEAVRHFVETDRPLREAILSLARTLSNDRRVD
jgi:hypothetical protein